MTDKKIVLFSMSALFLVTAFCLILRSPGKMDQHCHCDHKHDHTHEHVVKSIYK